MGRRRARRAAVDATVIVVVGREAVVRAGVGVALQGREARRRRAVAVDIVEVGLDIGTAVHAADHLGDATARGEAEGHALHGEGRPPDF